MPYPYKSPGVHIREVNAILRETSPSPICLVFGFSPHGMDSVPMEMSSKNDIETTFGLPGNGSEKYFVNAGARIISGGGTPIMVRLPYENAQKANVQYIRYDIGETQYWTSDNSSLQRERPTEYKILKEVNAIDRSMKGTSLISFGEMDFMSMDKFDESTYDKSSLTPNSLYVFDIRKETLGNSESISVIHDSYGETTSERIDFLGVIPVIVTASTAMYVQGKLSETTTNDSTFTPVNVPFTATTGGSISWVDGSYLKISADWISPESHDSAEIQTALRGVLESFSSPLAFNRAKSIYASKSVSDAASMQFPLVRFASTSNLDRENTGKVGIVVFEMVFNRDTEKTDFVIRESHIGTLGGTDEDEGDESIVSVVNRASRFINVQSTVENVPTRDFFCVSGLPLTILGMTWNQTLKKINFRTSIMEPIAAILEKYFANLDTTDLDLIVDAGMSTVAALAWRNYNDSNDSSGSDPEQNAVEIDPEKTRVSPTALEVEKCGEAWRQLAEVFKSFIENRRGDCMLVSDGPRMLNVSLNSPVLRHYRTLDNESLLRNNLRAFNGVDTSYGARYFNWILASDMFSGAKFWLPPSIAVAEAMARGQKPYDQPWYAIAGVQRGRIPDAWDISIHTHPYTQENDLLYENRWNYLSRGTGVGVYIDGNKTLQKRSSALDRVNVRRLCNWIKRGVRNLANTYKYEENTEYLRANFAADINKLLVEAKNNDGISDFAVVCDETNNTSDVIDRNELRCTIGVVPTRTTEFISITLVASNNGVEFSNDFNPTIDLEGASKTASDEWEMLRR